MRTIEFNDQPPNYVSIAHRTTSIESYCILRTRKMASWWKHLKLIFGMGSVSSYLCVNLTILYFTSNILYVFRFAVLTLIYAGSSIDDSPLINDAGDIRFHMNDSPVIWKRWLRALAPLECDTCRGNWPNHFLLIEGSRCWRQLCVSSSTLLDERK